MKRPKYFDFVTKPVILPLASGTWTPAKWLPKCICQDFAKLFFAGFVGDDTSKVLHRQSRTIAKEVVTLSLFSADTN